MAELDPTFSVFAKANQGLAALETYRRRLDQVFTRLTAHAYSTTATQRGAAAGGVADQRHAGVAGEPRRRAGLAEAEFLSSS